MKTQKHHAITFRLLTAILLLPILITIIITIQSGYVENHEQAHAQVCKYFGGEVIALCNELLSGHVICVNITSENLPYYSLAQSNVEAFGYQLKVLINLVMWIAGIIWIMFFGDAISKQLRQ